MKNIGKIWQCMPDEFLKDKEENFNKRDMVLLTNAKNHVDRIFEHQGKREKYLQRKYC